MVTPNLVLRDKPNPLDGLCKLRVSFEDRANPLTDPSNAPLMSTVVGVYQYPEFTEYVDIPTDQPYTTTLIDSLVSVAYTQALPKAETRAAACELKTLLIPIIEEYSAGGLESKVDELKATIENEVLLE